MSAKKTKEFTLAVQIAGSINKSFTGSLTGASTQLSTFQRKVNKLNTTFNTLDKGYNKIMTAGKAAFSVVTSSALVATAAVTAAAAAAINVGKEFETAFAGVKKTVEATEEEYAQLRSEIIEMSKVIPSSAVEIAGVMEIAGQLGIANSYLTEFTETMINLGVSTNMTAADAATALAKFANITQMDPGDYERLGSTIVDLGNNFATTEEDIVNMATRLAAAGDLAGLTEAQILAVSTAMSSVGIRSESGGSTMSKLLKKIQVAVETNSDSLSDWANVANMSVDKFKKTFKKDAVVALSAFIDGLNDTERLGKSAIVVLDEMELKEVRLSNTILSLANSGDLMTEAITMANKAWEENTALATEAGKRYETTDSKIQIMKNSFKALGIAAYDELQGPFRSLIDSITGWVQGFTEFVTGPNGISKWISDISVKIPTAVRKVKATVNDFMKVLKPFINVAKWLGENLDVLKSVFVGIGTALATYKIASTLTHIATALAALAANPAGLVIIGIAAALGVFAGAMYYTKKQHDKLVKAKIDKSFGDIALSMSEIKEVANYLIDKNGALTKLHEAISAFDELDTIQDSIDNAMQTINKTHWKVSIGMELTGEEQASYKQAISSYVTECQNYVTQQQYALTLAIGVAYDENDSFGTQLMTEINDFYNATYGELEAVGTKLNEAITNAFTDGLLDIDETKEIQDLLMQLAEIQNAIAGSNFDAALTSLSIDYGLTSGAALDADTFQNLQAEVNEQLAAFKDENNVARDKLIQNAALRYNQGHITKEQYQAEVAQIAEDFNAIYDESVATATQFLLDSIKNSGLGDGSDINKIFNLAPDLLSGMDMREYGEGTDSSGQKYYDGTHGLNGIKTNLLYVYNQLEAEQKVYKDALDKLLDEMKPSVDSLYEQRDYYVSMGKAVPENIQKGISEYEGLRALADTSVVTVEAIKNGLMQNGQWEELLATLEKYGLTIDEVLAQVIGDNAFMVSDAVRNVFGGVSKEIEAGKIKFSKFSTLNNLYGIDMGSSNPFGTKLPGHAEGGIFSVPHIAAFAENGPEAAIPLDGSANAISLWERTGKLLGMGSVLDDLALSNSNSGTSIEYKPTLQFYGEAPSQADIESAMRTSQDEFEAMMNRYLKEHRRVAF